MQANKVKIDEGNDILVQEMYMYVVEVNLLSQVFCTLQTNAIAVDTPYIVYCCGLCFFLLSSFVKGE